MSKGKPYAEQTTVSVANGRAELEATLERYGATPRRSSTSPAALWSRSVWPSSTCESRSLRLKKALTNSRAQQAAWEKAYQQKWRSLVLAVKAKLVSVADGIETFEEAFMAHVVMPDGRTVAETMKPNIALAYKQGGAVPLSRRPDCNKEHNGRKKRPAKGAGRSEAGHRKQ
jgi:hypothetical protein